MKIRIGFVSNSSSSSFTCSVCSEVFSGWDISVRDVDHHQCINGHIFCDDQIVNKKKFDEAVERFEDYEGNLPDNLGGKKIKLKNMVLEMTTYTKSLRNFVLVVVFK